MSATAAATSWPGLQKTPGPVIGLSGGVLILSRKDADAGFSLHWLGRIAAALDTPVAYFLGDDSHGKTKIAPGDPREKRLIEAWRTLHPTLRADFLSLIEHFRRGRR